MAKEPKKKLKPAGPSIDNSTQDSLQPPVGITRNWKNYPYFPGIILFFSALLVALLIYKDFGLSWDEPLYRNLGILNYNYMFHGDPALLQQDYVNRGFYSNGPVGFEIFFLFIEKIMGLTDTKDIFHMRHLANHIFFLISAFSLYVLAYRLFKNRVVASLGFILLLLAPRIYVHSFMNSRDLPFLSIFLIALTFCQLAFDKKKPLLFLLTGVFCGFAASQRVIGVMLEVFVLGFLLVDFIFNVKDKRVILSGLLSLVGFCLMFFALFPYAWHNPIGSFLESIKSSSNYAWDGLCLLNGEYYHGAAIPWFYFPTWFLITNPVLWLIIGLTGILVLLKDFLKKPLLFLKNTRERNFILYLLCFATPITAVIALHSVIYDDWRHLYFVYPSFVLIGLYFVNKIMLALPKYRVVIQSVCLLQVLLVGYFMVAAHPFQQVYFNELVSHQPGSLRENYEMEYWGGSYKQGLDHLLKTVKSDTIKVCSYYKNDNNYAVPLDNNILLLNKNDRKRIKISSYYDADYFITNYFNHRDDYPIKDVEYTAEVLNSNIMQVFKIVKNNDLLNGKRCMQNKQTDSAIYYFQRMRVADPENAEVRLYLGQLYMTKQVYDSAIVHFNHVAALMPDNVDALSKLGVAYFSAKNYTLAIQQFKKITVLKPNAIDAYSNLGCAYFNNKEYELSIESFKKEIALDPQHRADIPSMVNAYLLIGNNDSAKKYQSMVK